MIGDLFDSPWKLLILAAVIVVFFGARKMPDAARSLGRSMRILKSEVQGLHADDAAPEAAPQTAPQTVQSAVQQPAAQQQIEQLQQQIRDLEKSAGEATAVSPAPMADAQRTQQPG